MGGAHLHGKGEGDDLVRGDSESLPQRSSVFVLEEEMEERGDGGLCQVGQEELHCLLRELEGKLHDGLSERTSQLEREGGGGTWG